MHRARVIDGARRRLLVLCLILLVAGGGWIVRIVTTGAPDTTTAERPGRNSSSAELSPASCDARSEGSRWAARGGYETIARFGGGEEQWLSAVVGSETGPDGRLYLLDIERPAIVALSRDLERAEYIGREGPGPGELQSIDTRHLLESGRDWLARSGTSLLAYHARAISRFGLGGHYSGDLSGFQPMGSYVSMYAIDVAAPDRAILYALNERRALAPAIRRHTGDLALGFSLSTWEVRPGDDRHLFDIHLPSPPQGSSGSMFIGPNEARPIWTLHQGCVFASDGAGPWLVRYELSDGTLDTFPLPDVDPVPAAVPAATREDYRKLRRMTGRAPAEPPDPAAVARWAKMIVDPDGYLWILPEAEERSPPPHRVVRMNVKTGAVSEDRVPAFPTAFGRPGIYYAVEVDSTLGIARATLFRASRPGGE